MIFFKIIQKIFLPDTLFLIIIILGIYFFFKRKERLAKIFLIFGCFFYYLFSLSFISDFLALPLKNAYSFPSEEEISKTRFIVLLTGENEKSYLRAGEVLKIYFFKLKRKENVKVIISGADPLSLKDLCQDLKNYLLGRGVDENDIILEKNSKNTYQSAKEIKKILGQEPFLLVTSDLHMKRAMEIFKKLGTKPIAAPFEENEEKKYSFFDIFPNSQSFYATKLAFYEYLGILYYRLRYYFLDSKFF